MPVPPEVESRIADAPLSLHLATSVDDRPHVAPVWYDYLDGTIRVLTGGKKLRNVRENPRVAGAIEDADGADVHWRVTILGTARVVEDDDLYDEVNERMIGKYGSNEEADGGEYEGGLVEVRVGSADLETY